MSPYSIVKAIIIRKTPIDFSINTFFDIINLFMEVMLKKTAIKIYHNVSMIPGVKTIIIFS